MRFNLALSSVSLLLVSSGLAHPGLAERARDCSADSCYAALATKTATAKSDCSSFVATTVTPCPKVVKTTVTITSTYGCSAPVIPSSAPSSAACAAVTQSASAVPTYAAVACSDGAAFSSACGCMNVRASRTTLPASTVTSTTYKVVKATPTFTVRQVSIQGGTSYVDGWSIAGRTSDPDFLKHGSQVGWADDASQAEWYTIDANGIVHGGNGTLPWHSSAQGGYNSYDSIYEEPEAGAYALKCQIGKTLEEGGYLSFSCKGPAGGFRWLQCMQEESPQLGGTPRQQLPECVVATYGAYPICL